MDILLGRPSSEWKMKSIAIESISYQMHGPVYGADSVTNISHHPISIV